MNIIYKSMLAIALLMASFQVNAQACDCDEIIESTQQIQVGFSAQFMTQVNFNGAATTTIELCVYNIQFEGEIKRLTCGNKTYCNLVRFDKVPGSYSMICSGAVQPTTEPNVIDKLKEAYGLNDISEFEQYYRDRMTCSPIPTQGFTVNGGCKAVVDAVWDPNAYCDGAIIGENASGVIRGRVFPPARMIVPCHTNDCCPVDVNGNPDRSNVACLAMDARGLYWTSPCGTRFFPIGVTTVIPCTPTCGNNMNLYKMSGSNSKTNLTPHIENFMKSVGETADQKHNYSAWLSPNGNTLSLSSIKDVKQVNLLDISGKKNLEYKNITSKDIDISGMNKGIYLVQIIKMDNTIFPSIKIQK